MSAAWRPAAKPFVFPHLPRRELRETLAAFEVGCIADCRP
jgi:hypothetical protein